ncbi:transcription initiation factor TFIID subunit 12-like isoform X2 [Sceloporus undulatus]|uniref:transcription initiation factor TFIID subunit 12-like isoform X2 n=1 Tax=Sceloporus undulatus TaxID=8520 RepID=UPI001C4ACBA1|nr:transcription initiation factor TFIID subunit 12-like isoform X2 [Sceloporus undulatus]XP_042318783.1 transcription initiation factor TFIID subunit 12-like isoform X2 [Sceloporus undulatus]
MDLKGDSTPSDQLCGEGQNLSSVPPSSVSHFTLPHNEVGNHSSWTNGPTVINAEDSNITVTSHDNTSSSAPPERLVPTTLSSLNTRTSQSTDRVTNISSGIPSLPTPTSKLVETNQSILNDTKSANITSWDTSSLNFTATVVSQSEMQGPTAAPQVASSTISTLRPTTRRQEITPVRDHEAITDENTIKSTSASTAADRRVLTDPTTTITLTPGSGSSTRITHSVTSVETEQPVKHVQKAAVSDMGDDGEDLPSVLEPAPVGEDPLVIAVIFIFTVTVGIVALMGFLRYRQHSGRLQFRRLQDLPMDDMMEDTPLSLYSY